MLLDNTSGGKTWFIHEKKLVGGEPTLLKNIKVSSDDEIPNCFWKV
jgi:hypothetical protein